MAWFGAVFAKLLIGQRAFIKTLEAQILKISGVIYGGDRFNEKGEVVDPNKSGWYLGPDGILKAFRGIFNNIELTADTLEITANRKGYLPVGFIYFQLRGQPEPKELFSGTWENISSQFAGLFFRVEGGNAAAFGAANQEQSVQSHTHTHDYPRTTLNLKNGTEGYIPGQTHTTEFTPTTKNTGATGSTETRPVNTTIKVWKRTS
jgi:hypothetical protein